ncbi:MAG: glycosyltransferase, partial [Candidatus Ratteibacteria bacterium]
MIQKNKIEFLFVTDGSTDKTPEIVKEEASKNSNIKLFHKP